MIECNFKIIWWFYLMGVGGTRVNMTPRFLSEQLNECWDKKWWERHCNQRIPEEDREENNEFTLDTYFEVSKFEFTLDIYFEVRLE